jgi:hypothetical protein
MSKSCFLAFASRERSKMGTLIYNSGASIKQLVDRGFEMPIHFAAVGTNGSVVAGTYRSLSGGPEFCCQITAQTLDMEGLTAPVNIMYVDSKGESALLVLRQLPGAPLESGLKN